MILRSLRERDGWSVARGSGQQQKGRFGGGGGFQTPSRRYFEIMAEYGTLASFLIIHETANVVIC